MKLFMLAWTVLAFADCLGVIYLTNKLKPHWIVIAFLIAVALLILALIYIQIRDMIRDRKPNSKLS